MKKIIYTIFIIVALIQLAVPAKMIFDREMTLKHGKPFKFKTSPIDPIDVFRGKYVWLNFTDNIFSYKDSLESDNILVYVVIQEGNDGFAEIKNISIDTPNNEDYFFKATAYKFNDNKEKGQLRINFPFDRFYMEESKAKPAEKAFNDLNTDSAQIAYALVYIKDGTTVLKDVLINEVSISLYAKEIIEEGE